MNQHNDHVATCHCCRFLDIGFEGDWSDVTPGRGAYCDCLKSHFFDLDEDEYHDKLVIFGQTCPDFESRDSSPQP